MTAGEYWIPTFAGMTMGDQGRNVARVILEKR
jgi:hypothetical protein